MRRVLQRIRQPIGWTHRKNNSTFNYVTFMQPVELYHYRHHYNDRITKIASLKDNDLVQSFAKATKTRRNHHSDTEEYDIICLE